MEFTQEELFLLQAGLVNYKKNTESAIKQLESNIEGVASGRFCLWGKQSKEEYISTATTNLNTRKEILSDIVELLKKFQENGNR